MKSLVTNWQMKFRLQIPYVFLFVVQGVTASVELWYSFAKGLVGRAAGTR